MAEPGERFNAWKQAGRREYGVGRGPLVPASLARLGLGAVQEIFGFMWK